MWISRSAMGLEERIVVYQVFYRAVHFDNSTCRSIEFEIWRWARMHASYGGGTWDRSLNES